MIRFIVTMGRIMGNKIASQMKVAPRYTLLTLLTLLTMLARFITRKNTIQFSKYWILDG